MIHIRYFLLLAAISIGCVSQRHYGQNTNTQALVLDGVYVDSNFTYLDKQVFNKSIDTVKYYKNLSSIKYFYELDSSKVYSQSYECKFSEEILFLSENGNYVDSLSAYFTHNRKLILARNKKDSAIIEIIIKEGNGGYYSIKLDSTGNKVIDFKWMIYFRMSDEYIQERC